MHIPVQQGSQMHLSVQQGSVTVTQFKVKYHVYPSIGHFYIQEADNDHKSASSQTETDVYNVQSLTIWK